MKINFLLLLALSIGIYYALKYSKKAKKDIDEYNRKKEEETNDK